MFEPAPPMVRLEVADPLKKPEPEMVPFTVRVLLPMATMSLAVARLRSSATVMDEVSVLVFAPVKVSFI